MAAFDLFMDTLNLDEGEPTRRRGGACSIGATFAKSRAGSRLSLRRGPEGQSICLARRHIGNEITATWHLSSGAGSEAGDDIFGGIAESNSAGGGDLDQPIVEVLGSPSRGFTKFGGRAEFAGQGAEES
jgi:hypothetical protein